MIKIENLQEEMYNCDSYADFLNNEHFHHSDKGCEIQMSVRMGGRPGEKKIPMIYKKCLTHNVDCYKEGFEIGFFGGKKTDNTNLCKCGNEPMTKKSTYCEECFKLRKIEYRKKYINSHKEELKKRRQEKRHQDFLKNYGRYGSV